MPISGGGAAGSLTVDDEGTPLATSATTLDFVGAGVTATGTGAVKTISIAGGSGATTPVVSGTGTAPGTSVTIPAASTGKRILLAINGSTAAATAVACTNVTWTKVKEYTDGGGAVHQLWVGIVSGTSGTTITITSASGATSAAAGILNDALTPTLGVNVAADSGGSVPVRLTGATPGRLLAVYVSNDNTTATRQLVPGFPHSVIDNNIAGAGTGHGIALIVGYAPTGDAWTSIIGAATAGAIIMAELF